MKPITCSQRCRLMCMPGRVCPSAWHYLAVGGHYSQTWENSAQERVAMLHALYSIFSSPKWGPLLAKVHRLNKTVTDRSPSCQEDGLNALWPSDAIWRHTSGSILAQVMACCLTAPSHYLNQCWLIISGVLQHAHQSNFIGCVQEFNPQHELKNYSLKFLPHHPGSVS